jgi:hypothetical protein
VVTPWSTVLPEKLTCFSYSRNFPHCKKHESLPHIHQVSTTCSYPELDKSRPCANTTSRKSILILFLLLRLDLPSGLFAIGFSTKALYACSLSPTHVTCPTYLFLLDLITRIILSKKCRLKSSLLCSFLDSLVSWSLLGPKYLSHPMFRLC